MTKAIELSQLGSNLHVGTDDQIKLLSPGDTSNNNVRIAADFDGSGTRNVYLRVAAKEDRRAALVFESVDSSNASTTRWALGRGDSDELPNTHFYIGTGLSGGSGGTARLVIDNTGNVGIGTTNPGTSLHVRENLANLILLQRTSTANAGIEYKNDTNSMYAGLSSNADFWGISTALDIGGNATFAVRRDDGDVGIGTTSPESTLHLRDSDSPIITLENPNNNTGVRATYIRHKFDDGLGGEILCLRPSGGAATDAEISFRVGGINVANQKVVFKSSGNVGIGTVDPATKLEIVDTATTVRIDGTAGDALLSLRNAGNGNFSGINFTRERNSGPNVVGGSIWMPSDTSDSGSTLYIQAQSASAQAGVDGSLTDNNGVRLKFASGIGADSALSVEVGSAERFRIKANGNVGIGTNDPITELDVHSSTFSDITISSARTTGNIGGFNFRKDTGGTPTVMAQMFVTTEGHYNFRAGSNNSSDHAFRISANGNVGVGTDNPATKLAVHGRTSIGNGTPSSGAGKFNVKPHDSQDSYFKVRPASDFESNTIGSAIDIRNAANNANHELFVRAQQYRLWTSSEKITINNNGMVGINETNPGHYIDMNIGTNNIGMKMTSTDAGSYIQFADDDTTGETRIGAIDNDFKIDVNNAERILVKSDGNVGIATNNPLHKLHVHGGGIKGEYVETSAHAIWTQTVATGTGGSSGGVILKTNPDQTSSNLSGSFIYRVRAVVTATGTDTGATWLVYYRESSAAYQVRLVSRSGTSSNHPQLRIANTNQMELYTNHASSYNVRVITERFYTQEPDSTLHAAGADYHWQRSSNNLYYEDGNVGIGVQSPDAKLQIIPSAVDTNIFSIRRQDHATINLFRFFQDSNIAQGTGAAHINTTNRDLMITASTTGGTTDGIYLKTTGNVGIGTATPQEKLHVEGNIQINDIVMGAVLTAEIADDAYLDVSCPNEGGVAMITAFSTFPDYPQAAGSGMIRYDVGASRNMGVIQSFSGSALQTAGQTTSTSATDFADGALTVAPTTTAKIFRLFNRVGGTNSGRRKYKIVFL